MSKALLILALFGLVACEEPLKPHLSGNFMHRSTETVSDHETIDIYFDSMNDNTCYVYKNTYNSSSTSMSCVTKGRYLPQ